MKIYGFTKKMMQFFRKDTNKMADLERKSQNQAINFRNSPRKNEVGFNAP